MRNTERLYDRVIEKMDMTCDMEDEELQELIHEVLEEASKEEFIPLQEKIRISKELFNAFRKLDILQDLIEDDEITEIMINGTDHIFLEKAGRIFESDRRFVSVAKLEDVIQQIAAGANRYVNEASPIVDARLEDGSRVNVVLRPVALNGPIMTIRKFPKEAVTMKQLIDWGSIKGVSNLVRLEARNANLEGEGAVTIRDLIKSALRMRPDRIIVGEVRGDETVDMISSAMLNGHSGSMSTGHANNPMDMLHRLETMMLMGIELPLIAIQQQIASALDVIIHLGRLRDKSRKVLEITEVLGYENGRIQLQTLYKFQEEGMEDGKIKGTLMKENEITQREKLLAAGYSETGIHGGSG